MKLSQLLVNVKVIKSNVDMDAEIADICYDSRKTAPGFLFVAIDGLTVDGHRFIPSAVEKGAAAVICQKEQPETVPYILVENSREALARVSCEYFGNPAGELVCIGYTGTNGKTSSTLILKHIIEDNLKTKVGLIGTNGNMIGDTPIHTEFTTPESYELQGLLRRMVNEGCTHLVMEVSSHSLVMSRVTGIEYDLAMFTNLTQDHLDLHGDMESYAAAKQLLFSHCKKACVNIDDAKGRYMVEKSTCPVYTYAIDDISADYRGENLDLTVAGVSFNITLDGKKSRAALHIPGRFSVYNALGIISAAHIMGIPAEGILNSLNTAAGVKGRMEVIKTPGKNYTVICDYSHTPDSLKNALLTLKPLTKGTLFVLFGCGGDRDHGKRPIMGDIAYTYGDFCIVTSDNPRTEQPMDIINMILEGMPKNSDKMITICDRIDAIHWALDNMKDNDVLLLAGKGHEDYQIIGHTKHSMDERVIVRDYLLSKP